MIEATPSGESISRKPSSWRVPLVLGLLVVAAGCSGTQLLNNLSPRTGYHKTTDVPFDAATGLQLDVYAPRNVPKAPVVVFFFPGRWSMGDKADYRFVAKGLTSRGILAVLPNYRLYPEVRFPAFVEDAAQAVEWTRRNIAAYGGDPERIFVMGHSSGAHLAAMLALDDTYLRNAGGDPAWLKGMIGLSGPYDFPPGDAPDLSDMFGPPENFDLAQPIHYMDGTNPPMLLLLGHDDNAVNVQNTIRLAAAVERAGGPVQTVLYPSLGHGLMVAALSSFYRMEARPLDFVDDFVHARPPGLRTASASPPFSPLP